MRRQLLVLALAGLFGAIVTTDAKACHKKKCAPAPTCAPVVVCEPCPPPPPVCEPCPPPPVCEPCPPPPPVCEPAPKKCGLFGGGHKMKLGGLFHHKKAAVAYVAAPCPAPAPVMWAPAPSPQVWATGQVHASGQ